MLVKLYKNKSDQFINIYELVLEKEYEVIAILFLTKDFSKSNLCEQLYYIINDKHELERYSSEYFEITKKDIDNDFICSFDIMLKSFIIHPKTVRTSLFWDKVSYYEYTNIDKEFYTRFRHLLNSTEYAKLFDND